MTPSELNIPVCPRCGAKIRPEFKGDYFGYCSWPCLKGFKDEYEAGKVKDVPGELFGKKRIL